MIILSKMFFEVSCKKNRNKLWVPYLANSENLISFGSELMIFFFLPLVHYLLFFLVLCAKYNYVLIIFSAWKTFVKKMKNSACHIKESLQFFNSKISVSPNQPKNMAKGIIFSVFKRLKLLKVQLSKIKKKWRNNKVSFFF